MFTFQKKSMLVKESEGSGYNLSNQPQKPYISIISYHEEGMLEIEEAQSAFNEAQTYRKLSLNHYKKCGYNLFMIREALKGASLTKPAETDLGVFTSFEDYLNTFYQGKEQTKGVGKRQARSYLSLYENWDVLTLLKLDQPNACYRLDITLKIITWAKKKKEDEGIDLAELDHHLYFKENADRIQKNRELKNERERLVRSEFKELRVELDYYKGRFQFLEEENTALKSKLDRILSTHPELAEL